MSWLVLSMCGHMRAGGACLCPSRVTSARRTSRSRSRRCSCSTQMVRSSSLTTPTRHLPAQTFASWLRVRLSKPILNTVALRRYAAKRNSALSCCDTMSPSLSIHCLFEYSENSEHRVLQQGCMAQQGCMPSVLSSLMLWHQNC